MNTKLTGLFCLNIALSLCTVETLASTVDTSENKYKDIRKVIINPESTLQTIDNFAAADAWSGNFVGHFWSESSKEQISEWLFSRDVDENDKPKGIGLSLWRVNLGAGTLEQPECDIQPVHRRAEAFVTTDGEHYDWGKCAGQTYFMNKAREKGCNNFLLFSNSPLVQLTLNNKGYSSEKKANIKPEGYGKYSRYMANVAKHFIDDGYNISYISPINEPQVDWTKPTQEGSPWLKSEMKRMYTELDKALIDSGLDSVKILIGECSNIPVLYGKSISAKGEAADMNDENPENIIAAFFDPSSKFYLGELKHLPRLVGAHTYHNHLRNDEMKAVRDRVKQACDKYNIAYHETEWCMLPGYTKDMDGFTDDWEPGNRGDIQVALLMGRLIYTDIVCSGASAWGYWKGMELDGNHSLVALHAIDGNILKGGTVTANKILWALGNYSRFVRPGFKLISSSGADDLNTLVESSYISPDEKQIIAVFVNSSFKDEKANIILPKKIAKNIKGLSIYITDTERDLEPQKKGKDDIKNIIIPARSLTTAVIDL